MTGHIHTPVYLAQDTVKVTVSSRPSVGHRWRHEHNQNLPPLYYDFRRPIPEWAKNMTKEELEYYCNLTHWSEHDHRIQGNLARCKEYADQWWDLPSSFDPKQTNRELYENQLYIELVQLERRLQREYQEQFCADFHEAFEDTLVKFVTKAPNGKTHK